MDAIDDAAEVRVTVAPANARFLISATLTSVTTGATTTVESTTDVKVVRRELRRLTEKDRNAYFEALHTVFTTEQADGEALYGSGFSSHGTLAALHSSKEYLYHNNLFFETSHPSMQLRLERSLQLHLKTSNLTVRPLQFSGGLESRIK